jgi:hypothetical protein
MNILNARKEISVLPTVLEPDTIYAIRTGKGFNLYITDNTGSIPHTLNDTSTKLRSPVFTYVGDQLAQIVYQDGTVKRFYYEDNLLSRISEFGVSNSVMHKIFTYVDNRLSDITETVL